MLVHLSDRRRWCDLCGHAGKPPPNTPHQAVEPGTAIGGVPYRRKRKGLRSCVQTQLLHATASNARLATAAAGGTSNHHSSLGAASNGCRHGRLRGVGGGSRQAAVSHSNSAAAEQIKTQRLTSKSRDPQLPARVPSTQHFNSLSISWSRATITAPRETDSSAPEIWSFQAHPDQACDNARIKSTKRQGQANPAAISVTTAAAYCLCTQVPRITVATD